MKQEGFAPLLEFIDFKNCTGPQHRELKIQRRKQRK